MTIPPTPGFWCANPWTQPLQLYLPATCSCLEWSRWNCWSHYHTWLHANSCNGIFAFKKELTLQRGDSLSLQSFIWNLELTSSAAVIEFQDICYSQWMSHQNNHLLSELLSKSLTLGTWGCDWSHQCCNGFFLISQTAGQVALNQKCVYGWICLAWLRKWCVTPLGW